MDANRFDALVRSLDSPSRRGLLRLLTAAGLGLSLPRLAIEDGAAKKKKKKRKKKAGQSVPPPISPPAVQCPASCPACQQCVNGQSCTPQTNGTTCQNSVCKHCQAGVCANNNGIPCENNPCKECQGGVCAPKNGIACQNNQCKVCQGGLCVNSDAIGCDNNPCKACQNGACVLRANGSPCTSINGAGKCNAGTCTPAPNCIGAGDACTIISDCCGGDCSDLVGGVCPESAVGERCLTSEDCAGNAFCNLSFTCQQQD